ncbi:MAG: hypothetical protein HY673_25720, partial [Chloroflexi bacterium]|nr:hypothetical protein [Chloroflexota bacterium]
MKMTKALLGGLILFLISTLSGHAVAQTCVQPPAGLVSWWPGDGNANDIQGTNHATISGATLTTGKVDGAFRFDGNDYWTVPDAAGLKPSQITVDAWIWIDQLPAGWSSPGWIADIVAKWDGSPDTGYELRLEGDKLLFGLGDGSPSYGWHGAVGDTALQPGQWYHVAGIYDGNTIKVFVNGVEDGNAPWGGPIVHSPNSLYLGGMIGQTFMAGQLQRTFKGIIDEVEIYNHALSAAEIQAIFNAGSAGKCKVTNGRPVASAGPDQTVNEGTLVTLDGSGSSDPEGASLNYHWTQIAGLSVVLDLADPVHPTFIAPSVLAGGATLTFQLTVGDGQLTSNPDVVNITVKNVNHPPVADAGADQTVAEGSPVTLNGSASYDPDAEGLSYSWLQTAGSSVVLSSPTAAQPSFTAPLVGWAGATLTFALTVSDGIDSATDTVNVVVENINHSPTANAGADQTKNEGSLVTLDGTASSDPDNDPLTYSWSQLSGPSVTLSDPYSDTPNFTAPLVNPGGETLVFRLTVSDGLGGSATDEVAIAVLNVNDPPACGLAQAGPALLWPPNHKLVPVRITGVTDPDNDQVTLTVMGVTQDEPVNGLGDGDTSPDAVTQGSNVLLRAERAGNGNGRVYQVTF